MRMTDSISIIDTGVANLRSLTAAFERLGFGWRLTTSGSDVTAAKHVVLPGVGSFAAAAGRLDELQLRQSLRSRIESGRSTLCICLGMQLLCAESEESPNVRGLAIVNSKIEKFFERYSGPPVGMEPCAASGKLNRFRCRRSVLCELISTWLTSGRMRICDNRIRRLFCQCDLERTRIGLPISSELSGPWGQRLLENWLNRA